MSLNLKEKLKSFGATLPFMENRTKGDLVKLHDKVVTITEYGFLEDGGKKYICFITKEDNEQFYFGGQVLTENFLDLEDDGYHEEIVKNGVTVKFGSKKSKNNKTYTTVEYI